MSPKHQHSQTGGRAAGMRRAGLGSLVVTVLLAAGLVATWPSGALADEQPEQADSSPDQAQKDSLVLTDKSMLRNALGAQSLVAPPGEFNVDPTPVYGRHFNTKELSTSLFKALYDGESGRLFKDGLLHFGDKFASSDVREGFGDAFSGRKLNSRIRNEGGLESADIIASRKRLHPLQVLGQVFKGGGAVSRTLTALGKKRPSNVRAFFCQALGDPRAALHVTEDPKNKDLDFVMRTFSRITSLQYRSASKEWRHETFDGAIFGRLKFGITRWSIANVGLDGHVGSHPGGIQGRGINLGFFTLWLPTLNAGKFHKIKGRTVGFPWRPFVWMHGLWKNRKDILPLGTSKRWQHLRRLPRKSLGTAGTGTSGRHSNRLGTPQLAHAHGGM